jgi:NNP family nitrate/nitrite transporter-like MFS transporter
MTGFQQALLVAVPVLVGSLGRIPVGALIDRFGGRTMFAAVSLITIAPVLFLAAIATIGFLAMAAALGGAAGAVFAVFALVVLLLSATGSRARAAIVTG